MAALHSTYSSQEEIPERLRQFYVEKLVKLDGKDKTIFALNVSDLPRAPGSALVARGAEPDQAGARCRAQTSNLAAGQ